MLQHSGYVNAFIMYMLYVQKFRADKIIYLFKFWSLLCSPWLHLFDQKYRYNVKYYYTFKYLFSIWLYFKIQKYNLFLWCKAGSLLQSSVSHDPSEIILICRFVALKHLLLLSMLKTVVLLLFLWKPWYIYFFQDSLINRKFKTTAFIWNINLL